jgi:hypothetical protein
MKIKVIGNNREIFLYPPKNNPWSSFFSELKKSGAQIITKKSGAKFDVLIANSHSKKSIRECEKYGVAKENRILILWEPKEVNAKLYKPSTLSDYGHIFSPSSEWLTGSNVHNFNWPQGKATQRIQTDREWLKRKHKFVFIGSNKYSVSKGELYSLRRIVLKNHKTEKFIDLFGQFWNSNIFYDTRCVLSSLVKVNYKNYSFKSIRMFARKYDNYQGITNNKKSTLNNYKFAIVIENSKNYISEKLFESLDSQCIVLYIGANLNKKLHNDRAIQSNADLFSISKEVVRMSSLSVREQLLLMKKQHKHYLKINKEWENFRILKKLARDSVNLLSI